MVKKVKSILLNSFFLTGMIITGGIAGIVFFVVKTAEYSVKLVNILFETIKEILTGEDDLKDKFIMLMVPLGAILISFFMLYGIYRLADYNNKQYIRENKGYVESLNK